MQTDRSSAASLIDATALTAKLSDGFDAVARLYGPRRAFDLFAVDVVRAGYDLGTEEKFVGIIRAAYDDYVARHPA